MFRRKLEPISELILRYLREEGLETPLNQYRIVSLWGNVVGEKFLNLTEDIYIKNQTLYVKLSSSVARSELLMSKNKLIEELNKRVKAQVLYDIVFIS